MAAALSLLFPSPFPVPSRYFPFSSLLSYARGHGER